MVGARGLLAAMQQAPSLNLELDMLLPEMKISTGPNDFASVKQMQMERFNGERWKKFGPLMGGKSGG
jgi:branched-chain amino acid transport system substrate-binding protein